MSDPLSGSPVRDTPGTVRGDKNAGAWVKVGRVDSGTRDTWVDTTRGEAVSDYVMWLMKFPVVGVVPGSLADTQHARADSSSADLLARVMPCLREYLGADAGDSDEDVLLEVADVVYAVHRQARDKGRPIMPVARGDAEVGSPEPCGDVGGPDKDNPQTCIYPAGHIGQHSFEPAMAGESQCQAYEDRRCRYPAGHEGSHSYVGRCQECAADGQLCDLAGDHEAATPHDWMETFGHPSIRCRSIWTHHRGGYGQVWRCMFRDGHTGGCSFELKQNLWPRCQVTNENGARCWARAGHGGGHTFLEATR